MSGTINIAFLGCGFITQVHSRHLRSMRDVVSVSYASRVQERADTYMRRYVGVRSYGSYEEAIEDQRIDAVVVAVPPRFHLELTLSALAAGKHVLVEKPAFPKLADYGRVREAARQARRVVLVGENDHYKPLAVCLRRLLREGVIGEVVLTHFTTLARKFKPADDWRNDEGMSGGDAFFEEGIHWLHLANSLGLRIASVQGYRPPVGGAGDDRRAKTMLVSFQYEPGAAGALYYSREVPSLFRGLRLSKIFGRDGIVTFESNGAFVLARGQGLPEFVIPGFRDMRGYRAMYRDFVESIESGSQPEMSLEVAEADHRLMEQVYRTALHRDRTEIG